MASDPESLSASKRTKKTALFGFVACAILALAVIFLGHWEPRADFDVIGILWIMQNILPFALFSILLAGAIASLGVWLKSAFRERRQRRNASAGSR